LQLDFSSRSVPLSTTQDGLENLFIGERYQRTRENGVLFSNAHVQKFFHAHTALLPGSLAPARNPPCRGAFSFQMFRFLCGRATRSQPQIGPQGASDSVSKTRDRKSTAAHGLRHRPTGFRGCTARYLYRRVAVQSRHRVRESAAVYSTSRGGNGATPRSQGEEEVTSSSS